MHDLNSNPATDELSHCWVAQSSEAMHALYEAVIGSGVQAPGTGFKSGDLQARADASSDDAAELCAQLEALQFELQGERLINATWQGREELWREYAGFLLDEGVMRHRQIEWLQVRDISLATCMDDLRGLTLHLGVTRQVSLLSADAALTTYLSCSPNADLDSAPNLDRNPDVMLKLPQA
jgi:hypothetical protein